MKYVSVVVFNGLCNRLLPIISSIRLARILSSSQDKQYNVNINWVYTPVRSCLTYHGDLCSFSDLYNNNDGIEINKTDIESYSTTYEFQYWLCKDHIIDTTIENEGNIFINYALYTLLSNKDDNSSIFCNLKNNIVKPQEIILDNIGKELGIILRQFEPRNELQNEINKFQSTFLPNMIGLHLRKSDGGFTSYPWKDIIKVLIPQCQEWCNLDPMNNGIYLATDDVEIFVDFKIKLGNQLRCYEPPKILCGIKSSSKFNNDKYNVMSAVVELHSFSRCNNYIIGTADSTFSMCAMLMCENFETTKMFLVNNPSNIPKFI